MQLAFAYCFAPPRSMLKSGEALVRHLQENGFEQLALRVLGHCFSLSISLSAESKISADGLTARIFCSMLTKALASQHTVDIDLSLSCMLSMPRKEAKNAYHKALLVGSIHKGKHRDFARLESLGHLGRRLGAAWKDEQRRGKVSVSFIYSYILRESCSQFDSLPLTSLTLFGRRRAKRSRGTRGGGIASPSSASSSTTSHGGRRGRSSARVRRSRRTFCRKSCTSPATTSRWRSPSPRRSKSRSPIPCSYSSRRSPRSPGRASSRSAAARSRQPSKTF